MPEDNRFVSPDDVETLVFDWGTLKWQSTPDVTNAQEFSAGVVQLKPEKGHERHKHPESEEILYVINGDGVQTVADEERDITAGDLVHIPADVEHSTINTGWETMKLLAIYAPPGPEDVLREMPECEILPPGEISDE